MKLFNSLSKQLEDVIPLEKNTVRVYTCGPTVYDKAHIGNLASFIYADTLHRTLLMKGYDVVHAMNLTDVDDKTIRRSLTENHHHDPKEALHMLTSKYASQFLDDMNAIGNDLSSLKIVYATEHIEAMQSLITDLVKKEVAYIADDGVYFSIAAYISTGKIYGQLVGLSDQNTANERIDNDEYDKASVHDFALWKKAKANEPVWQFEINGVQLDGRPGWHIECSAMSQATLGIPFDIHTGGIDLMFPHHENEIAQSTALSDQSLLAKIFIHSEHILVDGRKMSKSLNNFFTLEDIQKAGYDSLSFRLLILGSHYRSQSNFSWESLGVAAGHLASIRAWSDIRFQPVSHPETRTYYAEKLHNIREAFAYDMRTTEALKELFDMIDYTADAHADAQAVADILPEIESLFGLNLLNRQDLDQSLKALLKQRQDARDASDWAHSDTLREQLKSRLILVKDTPQGQIWERQ